MISFSLGVVAGLFVAAAWPGPSALVRAGVVNLIARARARLGV
jgi:hypothetical protein